MGLQVKNAVHTPTLCVNPIQREHFGTISCVLDRIEALVKREMYPPLLTQEDETGLSSA